MVGRTLGLAVCTLPQCREGVEDLGVTLVPVLFLEPSVEPL